MDRFWCRFGSHFGSLGGPSWPKFGPRWILGRVFLSKSDFSRNACKTIGFSMFLPPKTAPKTSQDRPKTPLRRSWRATFSMFKVVIDFGLFWHRFWVPFGCPLGSSWGPLGVPFGVPKRAYLEDALGSPLGGLLGASWRPLGSLLGASWGLLGPLGSFLGPLGGF